MAAEMVAGFAFRFLISIVEAAPFLLAGLITAAVLRRFFGVAGTRRLFGEGTRWGLFRAWLIGMLLPVCSLGVIPVIRELRRAGVRGGTILAFAVSGPLFNPLSLLYGLTLSEPMAIVLFGLSSLVIVTAAGIIWDWCFPQSALPAPEEETYGIGSRRMLAVAAAAARESCGASLVWVLTGLSGVGLAGAFLPPNSLQHTFNHDNPWAPLLMTGLAIPVYATPMLAMTQLGMMFQHANSVGAAFVLLILGAGMNFGLLGWSMAEYGFRRGLAWLLLISGIALGLALILDKPLFPQDIEPSDHTHAFDIYCRPFDSVPDVVAAFQQRLERDVSPWEWRPLFVIGGLACLGLGLRLADRRERFEAWLRQSRTVSTPGRFDIVIPGPVLGLLSLAGLIGLSISGCYAWYPAPADCLVAMTDARIGALSAALAMDHEETKYWSERYDDWTRKMEVGTWLRYGSLPLYHRWKTRLVREQLEMLEHEVDGGDREAVQKLVTAISKSQRRMSEAYREEL
ncbi:MAG: permease [Planctomycetaceae bacterium]